MKPLKQAIDISFAQGLDQKTDPKRVSIGNFLKLENTIFDIGGLLQKRNGYAQLPSLPNDAYTSQYTYLTTYNNNLTAVGNSIAAYNSSSASWVSKGSIQPLSLSTLPLLRNNFNQTSVDTAVSSNGLVCSVYLESDGVNVTNKYSISDATTGQNISAPRTIPVSSGTVSGGMRVFALNRSFVILFTNTISAVDHLQYIMINTADTSQISTNTDIASSYVPATLLAFDACVVNNTLYIAYNTTAGGQAIKVASLTASGTLATATTFAGSIGQQVSVTADLTVPSSPVIYISFLDNSGGGTGFTAAVDVNLNVLMSPQSIVTGTALDNLTSAAQNGVCSVYVEVANAYSWNAGIATNYIDVITVTLAGPVVSAAATIIASVGLASKAFIVDGTVYFLSAYQSPYQPTYFLINASKSTSSAPVIAGKLAYGNGGGYLLTGLPNVTVNGTVARVPYLYKDLIQAVNKNTAVSSTAVNPIQTAGIYSQTGINLAKFNIGTEGLDTVEIGKDLLLSGGFLSMYDGQLPVEHNFLLWPDTDQGTPTNTASWSATDGYMAAQPNGSTNANAYWYQFTYEWTDNQGSTFRSAPSIPIPVTTTGALSTGSVTLNIPMLRLTAKVASPVKICIYRWSVGQQEYYEVTSIATPLLNSTSADTATFVDTLADSSIIGNALIYTTGGVVEDVNAPASNLMTLFDTRLWLVDAEDPNLLWFSKQVIEATPVEMSDLLTVYIAPTTGAQGSTGDITALSVMDDKLIIFKRNAIYYINGTGPDNTGANNQYSQPVFVTSTVGCANQQSIVFMPEGLLFQSDKGIWLLGRDLGTKYLGAPVEKSTLGATVKSALNIPKTNQVRFILDTGVTLMYDYFYGQWGTFTGVPAISSAIFQELHTYVNSYGQVYQESPGLYLDGSTPVTISFQTGPLRLDNNIQSYQNAYWFYLLGNYISPHKLKVDIYYDYETDPSHYALISPSNYTATYGQSGVYGQLNPYGGPHSLEDWRVGLNRTRCMALSIGVQEIYDPTYGVAAGAGLTLSGISLIVGLRSPFKPTSGRNQVGTK